ncbi:MAG: recombinase family protein [Dehalococcoidia bacterium]|nr:recombinase family protein [Dehalococcoidia bacterium]
MRFAFGCRAAGESYGAIARTLNAEGLTPRGKNAIFTPFAVKDMLVNRFYLSYVRYQGVELVGQHEPLVEEEMYERVQARRGKGRTSRQPYGLSGLLRGRIYCGHCGS